MRIAQFKLALSVIAVSAVTMLGAGPAAANPVGCPIPINSTFHLDNDGVNLTLNETGPGAGTAKYLDSPVLSRSTLNPYKEIGEWENGYVGTITPGCMLQSVSPLHVWLGLRNSDDQGTNFDLKADVYLQGVLVASAEKPCIKGLTRNPALAQEIVVSFPTPLAVELVEDEVALVLSARIGSPACGGHSSATGLRVYYDSAARDSLFDMHFDSGI